MQRATSCAVEMHDAWLPAFEDDDDKDDDSYGLGMIGMAAAWRARMALSAGVYSDEDVMVGQWHALSCGFQAAVRRRMAGLFESDTDKDVSCMCDLTSGSPMGPRPASGLARQISGPAHIHEGETQPGANTG